MSPRVPRPEADEFSNFYVPPDPKMSPDESRRLQEEQDAELARLIQDREQTVIRVENYVTNTEKRLSVLSELAYHEKFLELSSHYQ